VPPLYRLIQQRGGVSTPEMHRVFNMGIGMVLIAPPHEVQALQGALAGALAEETWILGEVIQGGPELRLA
jgi:phosphoribosylformylglycinamidine cyclo-ligase